MAHLALSIRLNKALSILPRKLKKSLPYWFIPSYPSLSEYCLLYVDSFIQLLKLFIN
jgi:hypothetical protein